MLVPGLRDVHQAVQARPRDSRPSSSRNASVPRTRDVAAERQWAIRSPTRSPALVRLVYRPVRFTPSYSSPIYAPPHRIHLFLPLPSSFPGCLGLARRSSSTSDEKVVQAGQRSGTREQAFDELVLKPIELFTVHHGGRYFRQFRVERSRPRLDVHGKIREYRSQGGQEAEHELVHHVWEHAKEEARDGRGGDQLALA